MRCNEIAIGPKMCKNCNSLICQNCIDIISEEISDAESEIVKCFSCKENLNLIEIQKITNKGLEMLHIKCPSGNINCFEEITIKNLYLHLEKCGFYEGKAKCKGCGYIDWSNRVKLHIDHCKEFPQECKFCEELIPKKTLEEHEKTCYKRPKTCKTCAENLDEYNIMLHPTKDVCMMNVFNIMKKDFESKLKFLFNILFINLTRLIQYIFILKINFK